MTLTGQGWFHGYGGKLPIPSNSSLETVTQQEIEVRQSVTVLPHCSRCLLSSGLEHHFPASPSCTCSSWRDTADLHVQECCAHSRESHPAALPNASGEHSTELPLTPFGKGIAIFMLILICPSDKGNNNPEVN